MFWTETKFLKWQFLGRNSVVKLWQVRLCDIFESFQVWNVGWLRRHDWPNRKNNRRVADRVVEIWTHEHFSGINFGWYVFRFVDSESLTRYFFNCIYLVEVWKHLFGILVASHGFIVPSWSNSPLLRTCDLVNYLFVGEHLVWFELVITSSLWSYLNYSWAELHSTLVRTILARRSKIFLLSIA